MFDETKANDKDYILEAVRQNDYHAFAISKRQRSADA